MDDPPARGEARHPDPPADLKNFPTVRIHGQWYRAHVDRGGTDRGCWWYASLTRESAPQRAGRFDLPAPRGTCYLASTPAVAVRERFGPYLRIDSGRGQALASDLLQTPEGPVVISVVELPAHPVADLDAPAAQAYGVDRALAAANHFDISQRWAAALDRAGHGGVRYAPHYTLGAARYAAGIFGAAGAPADPRPHSGDVDVHAVLHETGIRLVPPPWVAPTQSPQATPPPL